jgi:hypothetical protein
MSAARRIYALAALALLAAAPLSAAESNRRVDETCPKFVILGDADHATIFQGEGRDVTDILYKSKLEAVDGSCKHKGTSQLNIEVKAHLSAELGLAAKSETVEIPVFVAVIDPEQLVVTKETATATLKFERTSRKGEADAEFKTIKLELSEGTIGEDLEVVVGLQLDKAQLDYIRGGH